MIDLLLYVNDMLIARHDREEIDQLKGLLSSGFEIKDLGVAKKIFGMKIVTNKMKKDIFLTWQKNIKKVSFRFGMHDFRLIQTPLVGHLKISSEWCPQTDVEQQKLIKIPYSKCC